ncbi:hypothetical protein MSG28_003973 [Choristoneura fumiferana]|uniref:Uncharacterized protein n=1 Tax=Choristoneura fumiferana TaxID=7141 RepID=A0ACC0KHE4_CHOFU|nr:hypothetical protein MSG28_003973 [Choristoneura fumiferana]
MNNFSQLEAPVADCDKIVYNAQTKQILTVIDFMKYLESEERDTLLYLKDWHLKKLRPNDNFYEVPSIFGSDWLNEYAQDHNEDDFMTPLHVDVYNSFSWSVNVIGRKKWTLFPPGEEEKFKDPLGNLPLLFEYDKYKNVRYFEIIQEKGDAIFVPSGWHHQVTNELDTISINHNWVNACNIEEVWKALEKSLKSVEHEIEEFKDTPEFVDQCQLILKSMFEYSLDFSQLVIVLGGQEGRRGGGVRGLGQIGGLYREGRREGGLLVALAGQRHAQLVPAVGAASDPRGPTVEWHGHLACIWKEGEGV